jgi:nucleoid-associated protein YgaU
MASRYEGRQRIINNLDLYREVLKNRGVRQVEQYTTPVLQYPDGKKISDLTVVDHIWSRGDHYYKLADLYYGDSTYWWVIAQFNQKPTEDQLSFGDIVMIPTPLESILEVYEV